MWSRPGTYPALLDRAAEGLHTERAAGELPWGGIQAGHEFSWCSAGGTSASLGVVMGAHRSRSNNFFFRYFFFFRLCYFLF